ncbi:hypothetical protein [Nodosilinea sp. P-1105]|nr:hypothetical protein [Nodosilinea sp. P-1105]
MLDTHHRPAPLQGHGKRILGDRPYSESDRRDEPLPQVLTSPVSNLSIT